MPRRGSPSNDSHTQNHTTANGTFTVHATMQHESVTCSGIDMMLAGGVEGSNPKFPQETGQRSERYAAASSQ
jgi:hypothetical protein